MGGPFEIAQLSPARRPLNQQAIRARAMSAYLGGTDALCRVLGRYKMYVDTRDVGHSSHLLLDGFWEMWTTEVLARRVKPGMTVADVGANLGYFSVLMADLVGPQGRLHAFEPNPEVADRLRRNLIVNGFDARSEVHTSPLSGRNGDTVRLVFHPEFPSAAYIVPASSEPTLKGDRAVFTRRLDSYAELANVDLVKIDAEGAERMIFDGMTGIFDAKRPLTLVMEFAAVRYDDPRGFLTDIVAQGFSLAIVEPFDGERAATPDEILADGPHTERMLVLWR